ncbi:MAG: hypothetical protein U0892_16155 [Pirellulales bacterium]
MTHPDPLHARERGASTGSEFFGSMIICGLTARLGRNPKIVPADEVDSQLSDLDRSRLRVAQADILERLVISTNPEVLLQN